MCTEGLAGNSASPLSGTASAARFHRPAAQLGKLKYVFEMRAFKSITKAYSVPLQ